MTTFFTTFNNIPLQHLTTLQHFLTFYNIVQHLQHVTIFTTLRTTFYNILQHLQHFLAAVGAKLKVGHALNFSI